MKMWVTVNRSRDGSQVLRDSETVTPDTPMDDLGVFVAGALTRALKVLPVTRTRVVIEFDAD